jgi:hypothetical protein
MAGAVIICLSEVFFLYTVTSITFHQNLSYLKHNNLI